MTVLHTKARWVLSGAAGLAVTGNALDLVGIALLGLTLFLLFAVNGAFLVPPRLRIHTTCRPERMPEGARLETTVTIENGRSGPALFELRLDLPHTFERSALGLHRHVAVLGGQTRTIEYESRPLVLGAHKVGPPTLFIDDPSALRALTIPAAPARTVVVVPRLEALKRIPLQRSRQTSFLGMNEVPQPGDGFEFFTLRQFQSGDSIRSVNWRASARSTGLIVNQRQRESYQKPHVILDATAASMEGRAVAAPFVLGARAAASLAAYFMGRHDRVTFHVFTDRLHTIRPETPERQRFSILDTLARLRPHGAYAWSDVQRDIIGSLSARAPIVLVSAFETDPSVVPFLSDLLVREHPVMAVSAATAWGATQPDDHVVQLRRLHREAVAETCRGHGTPFVRLDEGRPLTTTFAEVTE